MARVILQFGVCLAMGLVLALLGLVLLLLSGERGVIDGLLLSGKPLAQLALQLLPDAFWLRLSGVHEASRNANVASFLQFCAALGQVALLVALGLYCLLCRPQEAAAHAA
ncbi:hypothetical protein JQX08_16310 [Pseudomonas sp. UL073]|uniref:Uncharacterized protein n=1 Tax=Zestomonas insulae TaxID=2809017 RepID=A0ABS2IGU0_9GAMM|nr:hypothetical protein [Pseudomonas insulae]MBM7062275.1 hypothetical protein [Pseudomonas insulae]